MYSNSTNNNIFHSNSTNNNIPHLNPTNNNQYQYPRIPPGQNPYQDAQDHPSWSGRIYWMRPQISQSYSFSSSNPSIHQNHHQLQKCQNCVKLENHIKQLEAQIKELQNQQNEPQKSEIQQEYNISSNRKYIKSQDKSFYLKTQQTIKNFLQMGKKFYGLTQIQTKIVEIIAKSDLIFPCELAPLTNIHMNQIKGIIQQILLHIQQEQQVEI